MSDTTIDTAAAAQLLALASEVLGEYQVLTGRNATHDLALYDWSHGEHDGKEVIARAIERDVHLWNPVSSRAYDHMMQAEMDRAHEVISLLMDDDDDEEEY